MSLIIKRIYFFCHPIIALLGIGLFPNTCNEKINNSFQQDSVNSRKIIPEIIGTPPKFSHQQGIPNDTDLVSQYIRCIFQDSKGNYWFGPAGQSVARFDQKTLRYFSKTEFFDSNEFKDDFCSVHAIAEDKKGNIWFGTDHGVIRYDGNNFKSYTEKDGLSNIQIGRKSILIDKSETLWVGTQRGVFRYEPSSEITLGLSFTKFHLLDCINVKDIMEDKSGNIWFASQDHGVFCYNGKSIKNYHEKQGLGDNYAGGIIQDQSGNYWFTMKGGICKYDGTIFTSFTHKDEIGGTEIWGIYIEKSGIIWITARGSTTRYDPTIKDSTAFTVFTTNDGLNCCVQSMYQDRSGNMWWGTGQGLYRFDGKQFYQVKQKGPW